MAKFEKKEKYEGEFNGETIKFNRVWAGHRFTEDECQLLLDGEVINIEATNKNGDSFTVDGKLELQSYNGKDFYGFKADMDTYESE